MKARRVLFWTVFKLANRMLLLSAVFFGRMRQTKSGAKRVNLGASSTLCGVFNVKYEQTEVAGQVGFLHLAMVGEYVGSFAFIERRSHMS